MPYPYRISLSAPNAWTMLAIEEPEKRVTLARVFRKPTGLAMGQTVRMVIFPTIEELQLRLNDTIVTLSTAEDFAFGVITGMMLDRNRVQLSWIPRTDQKTSFPHQFQAWLEIIDPC